MKYLIVLILGVAVLPCLGQKWDHGFEGSENSMPDWEGWSGESACEEDYQSPLDDILEVFITSGGMSFSDFSDYMNDYASYYSDNQEMQGLPG